LDGSISMEEFIRNPDTVDFIARRTEYLIGYIANNPEVLLTQTLAGRYTVGYTNQKNIPDIIKEFGPAFINSESYVCGLLDMESLETSGILQVQQQPYLSLRGRGVLVGIVDTGIDYTKESFIYEDGTSKVQFLYDQTLVGTPPPAGFFFGTEFTNEQISAALKLQNPYEAVPQRDLSGHGTFLASVAAGREEASGMIGAAPDADLIVVKLKKAQPFYLERYLIPPEQDFAYETSDIMIGIEYVLEKARLLGKPVVICLGLGTNFGGHDGTSIFEEYLTEISTLRGVCVCTAAGNESQARHHYQNILTSVGEEQNIDIRVGEKAGGFPVAIRSSAADRISVSLKSPSGELVGRVPARSGTRREANLVLEKTRVAIEYFFPAETSGDQITIVFFYNTTPGIWTIIVHGDIVLDGNYNAWLPLTGLVSPNVFFLNPSPYITVVVPASAFAIITCGGYNSATDSLYLNSSWGPTRAPVLKPDLLAPAVNVGGVFPSGNGTMDGTSVATAITAGASALLCNGELSTAMMRP